MTEAEMIEKVVLKIKLRPDMKTLDEPYINSTVADALSDVKDFINFVNDKDLVEGLITPLYDLTALRIALLGTDGLSSSSSAGVSESYLDDLPKALKAKLRKYRRLPCQ
ncbi:MAG: hypothetical protein RR945_02795 [Erysipelotrichaceae bacterium]